MIYLSVGSADMLARPYRHVIGGCHVDNRRLVGVAVRKPYRYGKAVLTSAKVDGKGAVEMEEKRRHAILRC